MYPGQGLRENQLPCLSVEAVKRVVLQRVERVVVQHCILQAVYRKRRHMPIGIIDQVIPQRSGIHTVGRESIERVAFLYHAQHIQRRCILTDIIRLAHFFALGVQNHDAERHGQIGISGPDADAVDGDVNRTGFEVQIGYLRYLLLFVYEVNTSVIIRHHQLAGTRVVGDMRDDVAVQTGCLAPVFDLSVGTV